ncbi:MAG: hypothetical protein K5892_03085, partial [Acholeplasmatales bacterium]|nr:hypothetical protein [Acholeplasmatales bacterium]
MEKYWNLLKEEKYSELSEQILIELSVKFNDYELWYLLFLCQNNNYYDFDVEKINNKETLDKALLYAPYDKKKIIENELLLYSNLKEFKGFDHILRHYQLKEYN